MTNEEKILEILSQMQGDIAQLKTGQARLESDVGELKAGQAKLETEMADVQNNLLKVQITQENIVIPKIQLLAEGHTTISKQIHNLSVINAMQNDIDTLKAAVSYLAKELEQLRGA